MSDHEIWNKLIKTKLGLLNLAAHLGNVSQACKVMGYSPNSFYRIKELYDTGGENALHEISGKKPIVKNRVEPAIEESVVKIAFEYPDWGQQRTSNELRKQGIFISGGGVRSVWQRHDLEVFEKRLKAWEARIAKDGLILTEAQMIAMERKKEKRNLRVKLRPCIHVTSVRRTYIKGVGRIYQQNFIDTYSRVDLSSSMTAKQPLQGQARQMTGHCPSLNHTKSRYCAIFTDRGTEYKGKPEYRKYKHYLQIEGIDHTKTQVRPHKQT